jgi:hypothetical protein
MGGGRKRRRRRRKEGEVRRGIMVMTRKRVELRYKASIQKLGKHYCPKSQVLEL